MRFTLFSIDSDDLGVTISMEENYQKLGAKYSLGGNLEKIMSLHSKTENLNHQAIET